MTINKNLNTPLYIQFKDEIKSNIKSNVLKKGEKLPSEKELSKIYGISTITVRKALEILADEGLIERIQGKGTFVSNAKYERNLRKFLSFTEMCKLMKVKPSTKVIEKKFIKNEKASKLLNLKPDTGIIYIERLRFVDNSPVILEKSYFTSDYSYLLYEDLEKSLFETISKYRNFEIEDSNKEIEIIRSDNKISKFLNVKKDSPIIKIDSVAFLSNNEIAYVGQQLINGEKFKLIL